MKLTCAMDQDALLPVNSCWEPAFVDVQRVYEGWDYFQCTATNVMLFSEQRWIPELDQMLLWLCGVVGWCMQSKMQCTWMASALRWQLHRCGSYVSDMNFFLSQESCITHMLLSQSYNGNYYQDASTHIQTPWGEWPVATFARTIADYCRSFSASHVLSLSRLRVFAYTTLQPKNRNRCRLTQ